MSLTVTITETNKGPTLKLAVAVIVVRHKGQKEIVPASLSSKLVKFDDAVNFILTTSISRHRYTFVEHASVVPYLMIIESQRNELAKDVEIKINVTCNKKTRSKICSEDWTGMHFGFGEFRTDQVSYVHGSTIFSSVVEVTINVHKSQKQSYIKPYEDSDFTDFNLSTQGGAVAFHKALLAAHSDVFKTMFSGNWKETNENIFEMEGYSLETVKLMKDFLYSRKLPKNYFDLCSLVGLAVKYFMADLKAECIRVLAETVTPETLYSVNQFACQNNLPELTYALILLTADDVVNGSYENENENENSLL